jgi:hypothetical protein
LGGIVNQNGVEETDMDDVDLSDVGDECSSDDAPNKEDDESDEHGNAKGTKSLLDKVNILDAPNRSNP